MRRHIDPPVRLILPYSPGGASDNIARCHAPRGRSLRQTIVLDNRPGGEAYLGERSWRALTDGYTLLSTDAPQAIRRSIRSSL